MLRVSRISAIPQGQRWFGFDAVDGWIAPQAEEVRCERGALWLNSLLLLLLADCALCREKDDLVDILISCCPYLMELDPGLIPSMGKM